MLALDGPPPVSLGLRRFVLRSIGPVAARFHPLDLTLVGPDGALARRALCVLTNTGGKSTLLKLISSVVNPGMTGRIGKGEMAEMVLGIDTSHVVLEWQQADGTRYVTGWVGQWPNLQKPAAGSKERLQHWWYTFRVGAFGIDDLPFEDEGARTRLDEFRRQVRALINQHPASAGAWADTQTEWRRLLTERTRIDSELFRYQAIMNAAEGGAEALVKSLKTSDDFVEFFVSVFDDEASSSALFREIGTYADEAADRKAKEVEADLCAELVTALGQFMDEEANHSAAIGMLAYDTERRRELAGAVRARAAAETARALAAETALEAEAERLAATNRSIDGFEDRRKQYLLVEADLRHAAALTAQVAATAAEVEADLVQRAWAAVPSVVAHDSAESVLAQARVAFDAAETELAPLHALVREAAGMLVAGLAAQADRAEERAAEAQASHAGARQAVAEATRRREGSLREEAALRRELDGLDAQVARSGQLLAEGRRRGDIGPTESAAAASARWREAQDHAGERRRRALAEKDRQADALREADRDRSKAEMARREAAADGEQVRLALSRAARSCARLLDDPSIAAVVGAAPAAAPPHRGVPAAVATKAAETMEEQAAAVEAAAQRTFAELDSIDSELDRLSGTDLLAAGADVVRAAGVLRDVGIGAVTGWEWVAGNVPPERRLPFVSARPDIVNGVVVAEAGRLDDARTALEKEGLFPRLAVVVASAQVATDTDDNLPVEPDPGRFVVEPHPGLYDEEKAKEEIARLQDRRGMLATRLADQRSSGRALQAASERARGHAEEWPDEALVELERRGAEAEQAAALALEQREAAEAAVRAATAAAGLASEAERAAAEEQAASGAVVLRLADAVRSEAEAATSAAARPTVVERIAHHAREAEKAGLVATAAEEAAGAAAEEQRQAAEIVRRSRERIAQVNAKPAEPAPDDPVSVLEARYAEVDNRLKDEAAGRDHLQALERAEAEVSRTAVPLSSWDAGTLARARELSGSVLAATPESIRAQTDAALEAWKAARDRLGESRHTVDQWAAEAEKHRPTDRQVHVVLSPDETPADADDASRRAAEMDSRLVTARQTAAREATAVAAAREARDSAKAASAAFTRLVFEQDAPISTAEPYKGDVDAANADLDQRRKAVTAAKELVHEVEVNRQKATAEVNARANDRRWAGIESSLRELCASARDEALAEHGERYLTNLTVRETSLRADIAQLDTHRATVIDSLGQTCDRLRHDLRRVKWASTLPGRVGAVGGQHAIVIDFNPLPTEAANLGLAAAVDRWATERVDLGDVKRRPKRLLDALSATVENRPQAGRWNVRVLKPRIDGDVTYCTPDRVGQEYSGGQELTLALLLYCALVAVRAEARRDSARPPGLLLLDNPFGKASNEHLIAMWQELAEESDVQLLCFTGLGDPSVLNSFNGPGTFRQAMRNDRNQRNGHIHVRPVAAAPPVAQMVSAYMAGPPLDGEEEARVDGVSYQTKAPFVQPAAAPEEAR